MSDRAIFHDEQIAHRFAVAEIDVTNRYVPGKPAMLSCLIADHKIVEVIENDHLVSARSSFSTSAIL